MTSKFVEAPGFVNQIEADLAAYGISADVTEIGIAVAITLVSMNLIRSVLWTA